MGSSVSTVKEELESIGFTDVVVEDTEKAYGKYMMYPFSTSAKIEVVKDQWCNRGVLIEGRTDIIRDVYIIFSDKVGDEPITCLIKLSDIEKEIYITCGEHIYYKDMSCYLVFKHADKYFILDDVVYKRNFTFKPQYRTFMTPEL